MASIPASQLTDYEWLLHAERARRAIHAYRRDHPEETRPLGFTPFVDRSGGYIRALTPGAETLAGERVAGYRMAAG